MDVWEHANRFVCKPTLNGDVYMPKPAHAVIALLTAAALAPASALAARNLSDATARDMALTQAMKDSEAQKEQRGGSWLAPEISCRRRASTWVVCKTTIGQFGQGGVICKRTVDVRIRSRKPDPVLTRRPITCVG
jgi:hypothetical protein